MDSTETERPCIFCLRHEDDGEVFGRLFFKEGITVHYYCLLFSSRLLQRGSDEEGIMGFLIQDIKEEKKRALRLACSYCKKKGGHISCAFKRCKLNFHFPCGVKAGCLNQFKDLYRSFCHRHRIKQKILKRYQSDTKSDCPICLSKVDCKPSNSTLFASCCKRFWFHRICIQRQALSAGMHHFKCCICNNKETFQADMLTHGVHIPDQDASWERVPNAYAELLERHNECNSYRCKDPEGRTRSLPNSEWEIVCCDVCGSQGTHLHCARLETTTEEWICQLCKDMLALNKKRANDSLEAGGSSSKQLKIDEDRLNDPGGLKQNSIKSKNPKKNCDDNSLNSPGGLSFKQNIVEPTSQQDLVNSMCDEDGLNDPGGSCLKQNYKKPNNPQNNCDDNSLNSPGGLSFKQNIVEPTSQQDLVNSKCDEDGLNDPGGSCLKQNYKKPNNPQNHCDDNSLNSPGGLSFKQNIVEPTSQQDLVNSMCDENGLNDPGGSSLKQNYKKPNNPQNNCDDNSLNSPGGLSFKQNIVEPTTQQELVNSKCDEDQLNDPGGSSLKQNVVEPKNSLEPKAVQRSEFIVIDSDEEPSEPSDSSNSKQDIDQVLNRPLRQPELTNQGKNQRQTSNTADELILIYDTDEDEDCMVTFHQRPKICPCCNKLQIRR